MIKIIGDVILDVWIKGNSNRYSPEAPVKILDQESNTRNLGGAANVACNLKKLHKNIKLYGSIGEDRSGKIIKSLLNKEKIQFVLKNNLNITTTKTRIVKLNGDHLLRIDKEEYKEDKKLFKQFIKELYIDDVVLIIDYNKGIINKNLIKQIQKKTTNIFVDPKNKPEIYKGVFLIKPNMKRLKNWIGTFDKKKCFNLLKKNKWRWLVVTDGGNAVHLFNEKKFYKKIYINSNKVKDVSGAGDTFLSTLVYFHSKGLGVPIACEMAAIAATKVVEKSGVKTLEKKELLFNSVFTNGVFDILHKGHKELFNFCKILGKKLVVGINSDLSVKKIKGKDRPYNLQKKRIDNLKKLKIIDRIIPFKNKTPIRIIKKIKPDLIVKGGDYKEKNVVGYNFSKVFIFPLIKGYSSTKIINKLKK